MVVKLYLFILLNGLSYLSFGQTKDKNRDTLVTIYFNLGVIKNDTVKNVLAKCLNKFSEEKEFHKEHIVTRGESLNLIIKREYGIISEKFAGTYDKIARSVVTINLMNNNRIYPNQILRIPEVPSISQNGNNTNTLQLYDFTTMKSSIIKSDSFFQEGKIVPVGYNEKTNSKIISYRLTLEDYKTLIGKFSEKLLISLNKGAMYVKIGDGDIRVSYSDSVNKDQLIGLTSSEIDNEKIDLSNIPDECFDTLVLVDYFDKDLCTHGKKVLSVVKSIINNYNLSRVITRVKIIPVNFYQNQGFAKSFLEQYYSDPVFDRDEYYNENQNVNSLIQKLAKDSIIRHDCPECIPQIYFDAIMKYYYSRTPDIISTSIWVRSLVSPVPNFVLKSKTNLITAGGDYPNSFVEGLAERDDASNGSLEESIQPIRSYFDSKTRYGCIIVGCETKPGTYYGMSSRDGLGVTTIGKGYNWQSDENCLEPSDLGTSFATPEISAKLFVAKAFWRSLGYVKRREISAEDAGKILILSGILNKNYVDHFSSGGRISLKKLLHPKGAYLIDNSSNLDSIDSFEGKITYYDEFKQRYRTDVPLNSVTSYWGLYYLNGSFFLFDDEYSQRWVSIKPIKFSLKGIYKGKPFTISSFDEFRESFTQFIILKN